MRRAVLALVWLLVGLTSAAHAQEPQAAEEIIEEIEVVTEVTEVAPSRLFDGPNHARTDRTVNMFTARPTRQRSLLLVIDHRAYDSLFTTDVGEDYLGFDAGRMKIGLGLRYGILDGLDAGFYRLSDGLTVDHDTYEFDARWRFLRQDRHLVDVALRAGVSWFVVPDAADDVGVAAQLLVDRVFADCVLVQAGFLFHSQSQSDLKLDSDDDYSGAVQAGFEWRMIPLLSLEFEIAYSVFGYREKWPAWTTGIKFHTYRHTFAVVLSNTQYFTSDGIVTNAWRGIEDTILGFQITREFNL